MLKNNHTDAVHGSTAVFIDVENIYHSTINNYGEKPNWSSIVSLCKSYGRLVSIQALGDWTSYRDEVRDIQKNGIQPVYVPLSRNGKSSLDSYLIVSAMKLFFQNDTVDTMILCSGDRDYIPLVAELKSIGKRVFLLAVPDTVSQDLVAIVDGVILYSEQGLEGAEGTEANLPEQKAITQDTQDFVRNEISKLSSRSINDGWVNLAKIGLALKEADAGFTHRSYGCQKLYDLLNDIPQVGLRYENKDNTVALARVEGDDDDDGENVGNSSDLCTGEVLNLKLGYGFIKPDTGDENVFFHESELNGVDFAQLQEGDRLKYYVQPTARGPNATRISRVAAWQEDSQPLDGPMFEL